MAQALIVSWQPDRWANRTRNRGGHDPGDGCQSPGTWRGQKRYSNVEFRLGEIENLPVADSSVDVIMSNCVINLSPDKRRVFREAFRVLRPGGRLAISDVIATAPLPEAVRNDLALYSSCIGGAVTMAELETMLRESGFHNIRIQPKDESREFIREWAPGRNIEDYIVSAIIEAVKPTS